jgi:cytidine deaminase
MKLVELDESDKVLVEKARLLLKKRFSDISGVSAGLRTTKGTEFFGLCVDAKTATVGMCAEYSAIGAMLTNGERKIQTIVAITRKAKTSYAVLPPCGKCRDFIRSFGNPYVVLPVGERLVESKKVRLSELASFPWDGYSTRRRGTSPQLSAMGKGRS